ncbi:MAG: type IV toxin-antitoxin system AbiEi family antitoxin [Candidatus Humimicrobiaceae bacterium]
MINNVEENIFNLAINEFNKNKEIQLEIDTEEEKIINDFEFDKLVKFKYQKENLLYCVEIKTNINNTITTLLLYRKETLPYPLLLITKYVNNNQAEELKKNGIQFIDTAGNAYINYNPVYIFIKGNKPLDMLFKNTTYRVFEPSGLKIIYALLINPNLVKETYRYIAEITNVALGTVGWTMNDLIKLRFVMDMDKRGRKLLRYEELLKRWYIDYNEKLKPKLLINKFTGPENWWINYNLNPEYAQWGGEVAAQKLTKYIKPQDIIIYADREKYQNVVIENKLRKDVNGNIVFLERFWELDKTKELQEIVDPILIYADLINTGNQRVLETAGKIYEEYINRYIRKN